MEIAYTTQRGIATWGRVEDFLASPRASRLEGTVPLIITSPPFPLNRKKAYGNLDGTDYMEWLAAIAKDLAGLLRPDGSLVLEVGNSWERGRPEMSTLPLESLLAIKRATGLRLCQQFVVHNPARLPSPAQWVNVERVRVKDSFTHVWWMSPTGRPRADNRRVLVDYSGSMRALLKRGSYNSGLRPSGHKIGEDSFLRDNGGAIPSNVIVASNTKWDRGYRDTCRELAVDPHPARMQPHLVDFFVRLLTDEGDLVMDPFAGSNTTGAVAESHHRDWLAVEAELDYLRGSTGRFESVRWRLAEPLSKEVTA